MREFSGKFSVLVGYRAHSAATHIAIGADEIVMTEMSELGPVDPSKRHPLLPREEVSKEETRPVAISVQDLRHLLAFIERELKREVGSDGEVSSEAMARIYAAIFEKVHPLAVGSLEQAWALALQISERVLSTHMDSEGEKDAIEKLVKRLGDYYKSHLYQINRKEAHEMGLKVTDASDDLARLMWDLFREYQGIQLSGEGEAGGEKVLLNRLGHIDSRAGTTIGMTLAKRSNPAETVGARWESRWYLDVGGGAASWSLLGISSESGAARSK